MRLALRRRAADAAARIALLRLPLMRADVLGAEMHSLAAPLLSSDPCIGAYQAKSDSEVHVVSREIAEEMVGDTVSEVLGEIAEEVAPMLPAPALRAAQMSLIEVAACYAIIALGVLLAVVGALTSVRSAILHVRSTTSSST